MTGTWGIIYEYVIFDKSIIPDMTFVITCVLGYIGIILLVLWYIWQKSKK